MRCRVGQAAVVGCGVQQHVNHIEVLIADHIVFEPQGLDLLGKGDFHVTVFAYYQLRAVFALEGFVEARPGCAVGADAQASRCTQRLSVPQELSFDVAEPLLIVHLQILLPGWYPSAPAWAALLAAGY
ncbi:hypothetical protein D3C71_1718170 [compost metagenome]